MKTKLRRRRRRLCCSGVRREWEGDLVVGVAFEKELETSSTAGVEVDPGGERCGSGSSGELDLLYFFSIRSG